MKPSYHFLDLRQDLELERRLQSRCPSSVFYSGKIFPSGKTTLGRVPPKKIAVADERYERDRVRGVWYKRTHWHYEQGLITEYGFREEKPQTLGLSSVQNYHKPKVRRNGLKGISQNGRTMVKESGYILQQRYGRKLGFYTLTCPYTEVEAIWEFNRNFPEIMRRFFQELKRHYERVDHTFSYVAAYEIQTERFCREAIPVLHCHYLAPCYLPGTREFIISADDIRAIWERVNRLVVGGDFSVEAAVDAQVVKKSAVGYLAKYLSKGSSDIQAVAEICPCQIPSQWWSSSRNVKKAVKLGTYHPPQELCAMLIGSGVGDICIGLHVSYIKEVCVMHGGRQLIVGISAQISENTLGVIRDPILWQCCLELV